MSGYDYTGDGGWQLRIMGGHDTVGVLTMDDEGRGVSVHLPAAERVKAAQALAGDEYAVIPIDEHAATNQLIDPADVRVRDVVEVEATDGSWLVRGTVGSKGEDGVYISEIDFAAEAPTKLATVRLVSRPEPEPDPEQVKALTRVIGEVDLESVRLHEEIARDLVRRGVTVGERDE